MKRCWIALGAAMLFAGCSMKVAKVAVAPVAPAEKPDPPALIYPQTALELPDPQPVPPEAIPKREPPVAPVVAETAPVHAAPRKPATPVKREPEAVEAASATTAQSEPAKASVRTPLVPEGPDLPRPDMIQKRLDSLGAKKDQLATKTGGNSEMIRGRIEYFVGQARQALARNDVRQADSLVNRAEVLAQDLLGVR